MITHEEVRVVVLSINDDDFECRFTNRMNLIEDYIDQQEKKDRLLGLYKEYFEMCQRGECDWNILRNEIPKQIKTLEEELKND